MKIQERIKNGEQAKRPQGENRVGKAGDGFQDRRDRRAAWASDDAERAQQGLPPRGVLQLRVLPEDSPNDPHKGHG